MKLFVTCFIKRLILRWEDRYWFNLSFQIYIKSIYFANTLFFQIKFIVFFEKCKIYFVTKHHSYSNTVDSHKSNFAYNRSWILFHPLLQQYHLTTRIPFILKVITLELRFYDSNVWMNGSLVTIILQSRNWFGMCGEFNLRRRVQIHSVYAPQYCS